MDFVEGLLSTPEPAPAVKPAVLQTHLIEPVPSQINSSVETLALEPVCLPGLFPADLLFTSFIPQINPESTLKTPVFDSRQIPFEIKGDPNEELWQSIMRGEINREKFLSEYKSLGETVTIEGDRGIPDLNKKRLLTLQQFFTPSPIIKFITKALMLDTPDTPASIMDNSCGIGKMYQFLNPACEIGGIEIDEKAYHMAKTLYPKANIIHDSLINHHIVPADYYIINPPFSIQLEKKNCGFHNAGWGHLGPRTSIKSHIAAMETAINSAKFFVAAMLPRGYFENEDTLTFERWVNQNAHLVYRLDISEKAFTDFGFTWPCSVMIYSISYNTRDEPIHHTIDKIDAQTLLDEVKALHTSPHFTVISDAINYIKRRGANPVLQNLKPVVDIDVESAPKLTLPIHGTNKVKISLSPDSSRLIITVDNLLSALKIDQYKKGMGETYNEGLRENTKESDIRFRRRNILEKPNVIIELAERLYEMNLEPQIDKQVINWHMKKVRWLERQQTPFEQFILKDNQWVCLHEDDGIKYMYPELYQARLKRLDDIGISNWLWEFQREDIARMSMKDTNLMVWEMGLGKSRAIIAMGLMYGVKHSLIVVEPKLKDEFVKEFKNIGIPESDYQVILEEKQLKNLRKFNIIAYNMLWRPLNKHTKKTFAKAMRRRFQFIAVDEAHKIKAKDSKQAAAVRMLKARYKLLSTGTPVANYIRNIFSLLVFGWGDGTERNPYGYYSPVEKDNGYGYTTGTRKFKEDFISIAWVTPQFEQTLDTGAKSREIPKIKDPVKFWAMMSPKILRRQRNEPDVNKIITFPNPVISTELIKMDDAHIKYYQHWLDNFAVWFKKQLRMEKEEGHKIDQMVILAHLTQLQFASTIPQSPKTEIEGNPWHFGLTTKQMRVLELVKEALANGEKIIVFSERPEFQRLMQETLKECNVKAHLFIGQQGIKERNILLDDFRYNGIPVLLATTSCGENGLNIPEANVVVIADTSWTPSKQIQAYSRILRPQQKKTPRIILIRAKGTIDEYMEQLMNAKCEAIGEGIDYQEASEFDPEKWMSYKDFTIKMLKEEGYL
ncbi:MAG: helicase-related protein [Methanobacteriota archaeon]